MSLILIIALSATYLMIYLDENWFVSLLICLLFSLKLYLQTVLKKSINETKIIIYGDLVYSFFILLGLILSLTLNLVFLVTLSINVLVLLTIKVAKTNSKFPVEVETIKEIFYRTWSYAALSLTFPVTMLIVMLLSPVELIITLKVSMAICTPIIWLQSSIKAELLRKIADKSYEQKSHRSRIFLVTLVSVFVLIFIYFCAINDIASLNSKMDASELLLVSVFFLFGVLFTLYVTLKVGVKQWLVYTGHRAGILAGACYIYTMCLIFILNTNNSVKAIAISFFFMFIYNGICLMYFSKYYGRAS